MIDDHWTYYRLVTLFAEHYLLHIHSSQPPHWPHFIPVTDCDDRRKQKTLMTCIGGFSLHLVTRWLLSIHSDAVTIIPAVELIDDILTSHYRWLWEYIITWSVPSRMGLTTMGGGGGGEADSVGLILTSFSLFTLLGVTLPLLYGGGLGGLCLHSVTLSGAYDATSQKHCWDDRVIIDPMTLEALTSQEVPRSMTQRPFSDTVFLLSWPTRPLLEGGEGWSGLRDISWKCSTVTLMLCDDIVGLTDGGDGRPSYLWWRLMELLHAVILGRYCHLAVTWRARGWPHLWYLLSVTEVKWYHCTCWLHLRLQHLSTVLRRQVTATSSLFTVTTDRWAWQVHSLWHWLGPLCHGDLHLTLTH